MLHSPTTVEFMIRSPLAYDFALLLFRPHIKTVGAARAPHYVLGFIFAISGLELTKDNQIGRHSILNGVIQQFVGWLAGQIPLPIFYLLLSRTCNLRGRNLGLSRLANRPWLLELFRNQPDSETGQHGAKSPLDPDCKPLIGV